MHVPVLSQYVYYIIPVPGPVHPRPVAAGVVAEAVNVAATTDAAVTAASDQGAGSGPVDSRRATEVAATGRRLAWRSRDIYHLEVLTFNI